MLCPVAFNTIHSSIATLIIIVQAGKDNIMHLSQFVESWMEPELEDKDGYHVEYVCQQKSNEVTN